MSTLSLKLHLERGTGCCFTILQDMLTPEAHIQYSDNRTTRNNKMNVESKTITYLDFQSLPWLLRIHSSFIVPSGSFSVKTHNLLPFKALVPQNNFNIRVQISEQPATVVSHRLANFHSINPFPLVRLIQKVYTASGLISY